MTIFNRFPSGVMSKGEITADLLHEERRLCELAAGTCDHGRRRGQCGACSGAAEPPPAVTGVALLSDPRWDVVASSPRRPVAEAAARAAIPAHVVEFIQRAREEERQASAVECVVVGASGEARAAQGTFFEYARSHASVYSEDEGAVEAGEAGEADEADEAVAESVPPDPARADLRKRTLAVAEATLDALGDVPASKRINAAREIKSCTCMGLGCGCGFWRQGKGL
mmetsp:Transcript_103096/g.295755  ORF Transcript_103096/g.295755 Transcript_103096/m.295755 type:complete len:226 (-) Transcript_103096:159-836(-)